MRKLLIAILLLLFYCKGYAQVPDNIQGEWVSNKFGYLRVGQVSLNYEFYWYQTKTVKRRINVSHKDELRLRKHNSSQWDRDMRNQLTSCSILSGNGKVFYYMAHWRRQSDTLTLLIKNKDTLFLIDPIIPEVNDTLVYARLKTDKNILEQDTIVFNMGGPFTASNMWGLAKFKHYSLPTLVIHNDSAFCLYGKHHVGSAIILNKAMVDKLNTALAHLPNDYTENYYEKPRQYYDDYSPPTTCTTVWIYNKKLLAPVTEDSGMPYLPNILTSCIKSSFYTIMSRFATCVSTPLPNNPDFSFDSTGIAGGAYIYNGDVKNMLVAKGRPKLIKEFKDTIIYYFRIDSVVNATGYFRGKDSIFFIAKKSDSVKKVIDSLHTLFIHERRPYAEYSPNDYHRLYSVFERAATVPAGLLLVDFKLTYRLGTPASGMWMGQTVYQQFGGKWYLQPDRYDKFIRKYLKKIKH